MKDKITIIINAKIYTINEENDVKKAIDFLFMTKPQKVKSPIFIIIYNMKKETLKFWFNW